MKKNSYAMFFKKTAWPFMLRKYQNEIKILNLLKISFPNIVSIFMIINTIASKITH